MVTFEDSDFEENGVLNQQGPIIYIDSSPLLGTSNDSSFFKISNCKFIENGGRCFFFFESGFSPVKNSISISNSIFAKNPSVFFFGRSNVFSLNAEIFNCTFLENSGNLITANVDSNNVINIANTVFWEDFTALDKIIGDPQGFNIHHSLLKSPDCLINGIDYCGDGMLYNLYPEFRDTMNNDFSLRSCSPAINQGDNLSIDTLGIFSTLKAILASWMMQ